MARSLLDAGVPVPVLGTRDGAVRAIATRLGLETCSPPEALSRADVVLLAVPDDALELLAAHLAAHARPSNRRPVVAHLSGALGVTALAPLAAAGLPVAAWHVLQAFPSPETGVRPGVVHALTTDTATTEAVLARLVSALQGRLLRVREADRARYHAAAVLAANGTAAVMVAAAAQLQACGLTEPDALAALGPLVDSARDAVVAGGIPDGLTGPWVRGDAGTVARHLTALGDDDATVRLYEALARVVERASH
ncbi:glycerol-3-phosphate dehydrogenase [Intrasporangium chromatireducens Q5-1]|uniref:Glycerol-3-phosphate dehydrogenase n=2 Tax=Intrasporangium TaxID=53357 RepID=W9GM23_9MICO|nr:glycerol-3-phosphate dehydrogenase [Intrasporangium chromatireducens Q5-1]